MPNQLGLVGWGTLSKGMAVNSDCLACPGASGDFMATTRSSCTFVMAKRPTLKHQAQGLNLTESNSLGLNKDSTNADSLSH